MTGQVCNAATEFVVIDPGKKATVEAVDAGLYARLDADYDNFRGHELVSIHAFDADWATWEIHPHGDEIVMLLSGRATLVLQSENGEQALTLQNQGDYAIVPRNTWHTARTSEPTRLLFITPGEGTLNRERPESDLD